MSFGTNSFIARVQSIIGSSIIMLMISMTTFAGEICSYHCDQCDFKSERLFLGGGRAGGHNSAVYCGQCKKLFTLTTKLMYKTFHNIKVVDPISKENFMGKESAVYPCPKCNGKAYEYHGDKCPVCLKGNLVRGPITGMWD